MTRKKPAIDPAALDPVRAFITQRLVERDISMKAASLAIDRNHAFLQQFITRGKPKVLPEADRHKLARVLQVHPGQLVDPEQRQWRGLYEALSYPLVHRVPECGAEFTVLIRQLVNRHSVSCPLCERPVDLDEHDIRVIAEFVELSLGVDRKRGRQRGQ